jgi:uncharacterized membrane protein YeiB
MWRYRLTMATYAAAAVTVGLSALAIRGTTAFEYLNSLNRSMPVSAASVAQWLNSVNLATEPIANKWTTPPLRVAMTLLWFAALYLLFRTNERRINKATRGWLQLLGQKSLSVYIFQSFLVFFMLYMWRRPGGFVLNTLVTALALAVVVLVSVLQRRVTAAVRQYGSNVKRNDLRAARANTNGE